MGDGNTDTNSTKQEIKVLRRFLQKRERQLSLSLAAIGQGKDPSIFVIYNNRGEFVEIVQPVQSASSPSYREPAKLCSLNIESF